MDILLDGRRLLDESSSIRLPDERERLRGRIERSGRLADGRLELGIEVAGRLVGDIDARCAPGFVPPGVFEVGIALFDPVDRGKGYGSEAIELLVDHLFAVEAAVRVQAGTAVHNGPMRRVLERLGFTHEGVLRDFLPAREGRVDCALYAITAADRVAR